MPKTQELQAQWVSADELEFVGGGSDRLEWDINSLLNLREACEIFSVEPWQVSVMVQQGMLPAPIYISGIALWDKYHTSTSAKLAYGNKL